MPQREPVLTVVEYREALARETAGLADHEDIMRRFDSLVQAGQRIGYLKLLRRQGVIGKDRDHGTGQESAMTINRNTLSLIISLVIALPSWIVYQLYLQPTPTLAVSNAMVFGIVNTVLLTVLLLLVGRADSSRRMDARSWMRGAIVLSMSFTLLLIILVELATTRAFI